MACIPGFWIALATALLASGPARAASLFFQMVSTSATSICAAPCYQLQVYLEDPTRALEIRKIEMDIDIVDASAATLPTVPGGNTNAAPGNANYEDPEGNIVVLPWSQGNRIVASQRAGFDAFVMVEAEAALSVNSLAATLEPLFSLCGSVCPPIIIRRGLEANRLYLGRFNLTGVTPGGPISFGLHVDGILGEGPMALDLTRLNGGSCTFDASGACAIPEPAGILLLGAALLHVALRRLSAS